MDGVVLVAAGEETLLTRRRSLLEGNLSFWGDKTADNRAVWKDLLPLVAVVVCGAKAWTTTSRAVKAQTKKADFEIIVNTMTLSKNRAVICGCIICIECAGGRAKSIDDANNRKKFCVIRI